MPRYKIADYLTQEGITRALEATFVLTPYPHEANVGDLPPEYLRTIEGFCPLGLAENLVDDDGIRLYTPTSGQVADAVTERLDDATLKTWEAVNTAADAFIGDWDGGRITDLAEALGYQPK